MQKGGTRFTMGRLLISAGLLLKIYQICAVQWNVEWAAGTVISMMVLCATAGGLAVFAYERHKTSRYLAAADAAVLVMSAVLQGFAGYSGAAAVMFTICYAGAFILYGLMLISLRHTARKAVGVLVFVLGLIVILQILSVLALPSATLTGILLVEYVLMAIGLYL